MEDAADFQCFGDLTTPLEVARGVEAMLSRNHAATSDRSEIVGGEHPCGRVSYVADYRSSSVLVLGHHTGGSDCESAARQPVNENDGCDASPSAPTPASSSDRAESPCPRTIGAVVKTT